MTGARVWLFRLPSGQLVAALSLDARCELPETIDLLEDCYFGDVQIGDAAPRRTCTPWPSSSAPRTAPSDGLPSRTPPDRVRRGTRAEMTAKTWSSG